MKRDNVSTRVEPSSVLVDVPGDTVTPGVAGPYRGQTAKAVETTKPDVSDGNETKEDKDNG